MIVSGLEHDIMSWNMREDGRGLTQTGGEVDAWSAIVTRTIRMSFGCVVGGEILRDQ